MYMDDQVTRAEPLPPTVRPRKQCYGHLEVLVYCMYIQRDLSLMPFLADRRKHSAASRRPVDRVVESRSRSPLVARLPDLADGLSGS